MKRLKYFQLHQQRYEAMEKALREAEWGASRPTLMGTSVPACPICLHTKPEGHADGCHFIAAMTPTTPDAQPKDPK